VLSLINDNHPIGDVGGGKHAFVNPSGSRWEVTKQGKVSERTSSMHRRVVSGTNTWYHFANEIKEITYSRRLLRRLVVPQRWGIDDPSLNSQRFIIDNHAELPDIFRLSVFKHLWADGQ
jgi:hypothetical protein